MTLEHAISFLTLNRCLERVFSRNPQTPLLPARPPFFQCPAKFRYFCKQTRIIRRDCMRMRNNRHLPTWCPERLCGQRFLNFYAPYKGQDVCLFLLQRRRSVRNFYLSVPRAVFNPLRCRHKSRSVVGASGSGPRSSAERRARSSTSPWLPLRLFAKRQRREVRYIIAIHVVSQVCD